MEHQYEDFHSDEFGEITDVIWDGDNTIWDWVKYAVVAYEAMAKTIAEETHKSEDEVAAAMKHFYTSVGTMEDEGLIQGLEAAGFFNHIPGFNKETLIKKVQEAFTKERQKHLKLYLGIQKVFKTIHDHKINNRILTDAPARQAKMRIKKSRINLYLHQVNALPSKTTRDLPQIFQEREQQGAYDVDFEITEIPTEKPHSNLEEILQMSRDHISKHVVIIGDNDRKDMELVRKYGCRGIHAVYGESHPDLLQRLLRFSPAKVAQRNMAIAEAAEKSNDFEFHSEMPQNQGVIIKIKEPKEILKVLNLEEKRKW